MAITQVTLCQKPCARPRSSGHLPYDPTKRLPGIMKTTLNIDDSVMSLLRREAARSGRTMSELVEMALRQLLSPHREALELPPLPFFQSGGALVNVSNRDALYSAMNDKAG